MVVVAKATVSRMAPSFDFTFSVSPRSVGNGGMAFGFLDKRANSRREFIFVSFGLITGVLQRGQRSKVSSNFTPQFTQ